jgi:hypothetical protein
MLGDQTSIIVFFATSYGCVHIYTCICPPSGNQTSYIHNNKCPFLTVYLTLEEKLSNVFIGRRTFKFWWIMRWWHPCKAVRPGKTGTEFWFASGTWWFEYREHGDLTRENGDSIRDFMRLKGMFWSYRTYLGVQNLGCKNMGRTLRIKTPRSWDMRPL